VLRDALLRDDAYLRAAVTALVSRFDARAERREKKATKAAA
jgi:hypothetical protein